MQGLFLRATRAAVSAKVQLREACATGPRKWRTAALLQVVTREDSAQVTDSKLELT